MEVYPRVEHIESREEAHQVIVSHTKAEKRLNFSEQTRLHAGLQKMANWVRALKAIPQPSLFNEIELEENIPKHWQAQ